LCPPKGSKEDIKVVPNPPTGTVTFLFTDIEGSTKLWERDSSAMRVALARHDKILRETIEIQGGHVFKTVGDAFCAAFSTATDALKAALESQRRLFFSEWEQIRHREDHVHGTFGARAYKKAQRRCRDRR
jgi:class 3 adenylate cyclase